jgi:hypothetical protein
MGNKHRQRGAVLERYFGGADEDNNATSSIFHCG